MSRPGSSNRGDGLSPPSTPLQTARGRSQAGSPSPARSPENERLRRPSIRLRRPPSYQTIMHGAGSTPVERPGSSREPSTQQGASPVFRRPSAGAAPTTRPRAGTSSHAVIYERPSMEVEAAVEGNRRRSSSDPLRLNRPAIAAAASQRPAPYMPEVQEDNVFTGGGGNFPQTLDVPRPPVRKRNSVASMAGSLFRFPTYNNSATSLDMQGDRENFDEQLVDVLDTVGMCTLETTRSLDIILTLARPRSFYPLYSHQSPKLPLYSRPGQIRQSQTNIHPDSSSRSSDAS